MSQALLAIGSNILPITPFDCPSLELFQNDIIKMAKDYYKILEISKNATAGEIKKAYKKLALKYHPVN